MLSASQANLIGQLADDPPAIGDTLPRRVPRRGPARPGQSAPKLFRVEVTHRSTATPAASDLI